MTKINLFMKILFLLIAIIFCAIPQCSSAISDKRLCYDPDCSVPISLAKTVINYIPREPDLLGFAINTDVKVYSKEAGSRTDLWGVEINGKRGYVSKIFLKESKVLHKNLKYEVPTVQVHKDTDHSKDSKIQPKEKTSKLPSKNTDGPHVNKPELATSEEVQHTLNGVTPTYKVLEGTTVHFEQNVPSIKPDLVSEPVIPSSQETVESNHVVTPNIEKNEPNTLNVNPVNNNQGGHNILHGLNFRSFMSNSEEIAKLPGIEITTGIPPVEAPAVLEETDKKAETPKDTDSTQTVTEDASNLAVADDSHKVGVNENSHVNVEPSETIASSNFADISVAPADQAQEKNEENTESHDEHNLQKSPENSISAPVPTETKAEMDEKVKLPASQENEEQGNAKSTETSEENIDTQQDTNDDSLGKYNTDSNVTTASSSKTERQDEHISNPISIENEVEIKEEMVTVNSNDKKEFILEPATILKENVISENQDIADKDSNENSFEENISDTVTTSSIETHVSVSTEKNSGNSNDESNKAFLHDEHHINYTEAEVASLKPAVSNLEASPVVEPEEVNTHLQPNVEITSSVSTESDKTISDEKSASTINKEDTAVDSQLKPQDQIQEESKVDVSMTAINDGVLESNSNVESVTNNEMDVNNNIDINDTLNYEFNIAKDPTEATQHSDMDNEKANSHSSEQFMYSSQKNVIHQDISNFNEFHNRNLLNVETSNHNNIDTTVRDDTVHLKDEILPEHGTGISDKTEVLNDNLSENSDIEKNIPDSILHEMEAVSTPDVCTAEYECKDSDNIQNHLFIETEENNKNEKSVIMSSINFEHNYWLTLLYLSITAVTMLVFSLGYYYIENMRRDGQLIAKVNKLEKELLVSIKECTMLTDNLKATKEKLTCIEDESFGSNEMVLSLKADLEASQAAKVELEDQIAMLEKDLETTTEAGLELERMLREVLFSNNEVNPLAQSVEDLQARLNAQQATNESLTNALNLKTQENEALSAELASTKIKYEQLEVELTQVTANLKIEIESKRNIEQTLLDKVQHLEMQLKEISTEKIALQKVLKGKEVEIKDLVDVVNQLNSNNFDFETLYEASHIKAEATAILEERNELKVRLNEVEGAHNLLEEHVKLVKEEVATLSEQCKAAEREKKEAETRLEVLSKFFKEKEAERQKEEAIWLQKQGEVTSTVERIQTMQNEIQNYKQQLEMLKREIIDQEREYKGQISSLETKAHEQWVVTRQMERRLEESKAESAQLRNRLTLIEKNINEVDPDTKIHRLEANGETTTSPPLFIGAESSSSPIMFSGSSGVPPPPPPSYMHSIFPPYLPPPLPTTSGVPPYEVGQRPPPLGGRLSSPPPMPLQPPSSRYENAGSPPPPISPHLLPPFNHRSPPPPFGGEHIHPPPPPPPGSILPPPPGATHPWGEESLPPLRNSGYQPPQRKERVRNDKDYQPLQREQRVRNDKDSLRSSVESLDKTHHSI